MLWRKIKQSEEIENQCRWEGSYLKSLWQVSFEQSSKGRRERNMQLSRDRAFQQRERQVKDPESGESSKEQRGSQWPGAVSRTAVGGQGRGRHSWITAGLVCMVGVWDFRREASPGFERKSDRAWIKFPGDSSYWEVKNRCLFLCRVACSDCALIHPKFLAW